MSKFFSILKFKAILLMLGVLCAGGLLAKPVCIGEMCYPSEEAARDAGVSDEEIQAALNHENVVVQVNSAGEKSSRVRLGYQTADQLLAFLHNDKVEQVGLEDHSLLVILLLVLFGGMVANLTPCVLPLVPVNLILVGRGWQRGAAYGLGIALAYGALGIAAAFGGLAFGVIQASPWFNVVVAVVFTVLALAMSEVFFLDFSKFRPKYKQVGKRGLGGVFLLGMGAAVLAGACVEPILLATLMLTAKWVAAGKVWAVGLPLVLGLGMGLPWPLAAAGFAVLPKPGAWMRWVNRGFALVFLGLAVWYGSLAWRGFAGESENTASQVEGVNNVILNATPKTWADKFKEARLLGKPIVVDVWASWCKNCLAMDRVTWRDERVKNTLKDWTLIRLQAEDLSEFLELADFRDLSIKGIPAVIIFDGEVTK